VGGAVALVEKWPVLGRHEQAAVWLGIWVDLGRAPRTIDAYGRGLAEYLLLCEREQIDPVTASRAHIAVFVRELISRPRRREPNAVSLDSGGGLANATIQQRLSVTWNLTAVETISLQYDHELRRCVGHGSAGGQVAGARPARTSRRLAASVG
jgi:hypothetical protein